MDPANPPIPCCALHVLPRETLAPLQERWAQVQVTPKSPSDTQEESKQKKSAQTYSLKSFLSSLTLLRYTI